MAHRDPQSQLFARRGALILGMVTVLALLGVSVHADPIQDGALAPYRAGWFANFSGHRILTCAETCKTKAPGTLPEYEASAVPPTKRAFLCKVPGRPVGNLRTWLYGSQFDGRPACYTTGLDLKGRYSQRFFCLCVR